MKGDAFVVVHSIPKVRLLTCNYSDHLKQTILTIYMIHCTIFSLLESK